MQILFAHSAGPQGPKEGSGYFVAALRKALGPEYDVRYPVMPDPDNPAYAPWKARLQQELAALDEGAMIVGHSLGGSVLLKLLAEDKARRRIAGIFLVATPFWSRASGPDLAEFVLPRGFAGKLPSRTRIFLYHSRDDEFVPFAHLARYARALPRATVRELDGYGHLYKKRCRELIADIIQLESAIIP